MARNCGCAGASCGCLIVGVNGITVAGIGTAEDPYRIGAELGDLSEALVFQDSDSINFTVIGDGTPSDPMTVSAEAIAQKFPVYTTGGRPSAAASGAGSYYYDSTLDMPMWSDGVSWLPAVPSEAEAIANSSLSNRLGPTSVSPLPPVTTDVPTVSWGAAATITARVESPVSENLTVLGRNGTWDGPFGVIAIGAMYSGRDFFMDGDTVEFGWREQVANGTRIHIFVDGAPITATPYVMNAGGVPATAAGTIYYTKLVFPSSKRRRITIYTANMYGWHSFRFPIGTTFTAAPEMPRIAVISDSFCAGSTPSPLLQAIAVPLGRMLSADVVVASYGGTGYTTAGAFDTFGSTTRRAVALERPVDAIVFIGSVNDSLAGLGAAATAAYAAYAADAPGVPQYVFGIQPTNATDTVGVDRAQRNDAIRAAALAAPSVRAFHDMIGLPTAVPPTAYNPATLYGAGARVTYLGSVWRVISEMTSTFSAIAPGTSGRWELETYQYTGTGQVGTTTGNGTRDTFLGSDGIHPAATGSLALAQRIAQALREDFVALGTP